MSWLPRAWISAVITGALGMSAAVHAERPPLRAYTVADGLAHDRVASILADSRGFIWFGTAHGLSRFDGARFTNYGTADGFSVASATAIVELEDHGYLVGTNGGGIAWYRPRGGEAHVGSERRDAPRRTESQRFRMFLVDDRIAAANRVNVLFRDRQERVWVGTDGGLFELAVDRSTLRFARVGLGTSARDESRVQVWSLDEDTEGRLWIGSSSGLSRRTRDGRVDHDAIHPAQGADHVRAVLCDPERGVWAGHDAGLFLVRERSEPSPGHKPQASSSALLAISHPGDTRGTLGHRRHFTVRDGLSNDKVHALHRTPDGTIWIGTALGLTRLHGDRFSSTGFSALSVGALAEDGHGNLWIGLFNRGVVRLASHGLSTFTPEDGLASPGVVKVFETRGGELAVVTHERALSVFDGTGFRVVRPNLPEHVTTLGRGQHIVFMEDHRGDWWIPSGDGLYRFSGARRPDDLSRLEPSAFYTARHGLAGGDIWRLFEDSTGDIWISTRVPDRNVLTRWERATGQFHRYSDADGLPPYNAVVSFTEDRSGQLWLGFWDGGAARLRAGRFELFSAAGGVRHPVVAWHLDRSGGLWGATLGGGLIHIDQPGAAHPAIRTIGTSDGLPSDRVISLTEDATGYLYVGSLVGVTRLNVSDGSLRHYTAEDGLPSNEVTAAYRDRSGTLWFGTAAGLSRLVPDDGDTRETTQLLIGGARVGGVPLPIPDLGTADAGPFELDPDQRHVQIDYLPLGASQLSGIEYRLEGAEQDWTSAADGRTVTYAQLASGSYRFVVRAPSGSGWADASMTFAIRPPIWQRTWFLVSMAGLVVTGLFAAHRTRVARLVAVERVRTRIASDLHDDIGSNLSQIAILGELLHQRSTAGPPEPSLARIADLSRESVDSLSDIVWSIDPDKDRLGNLAVRMRRLASDLLSSRDLDVTFDVHGAADVPIAADARRDVYLAFKEALHNVVRHSGCQTVAIEVRLEDGRLGFRVRDDGRGFDPAQASGHGLSSLRQRAERLGGAVTVTSSPGAGTLVELAVPNRARSRTS